MSRRRKHKHEEHQNHEAWAIPYGDLITLLLAFFVVMYAISSVNEGKYRVLSDALFAEFRGTPRTMEPIQVGEKQVGSGADVKTTLVEQAMLKGQPRKMMTPIQVNTGLPKPPVNTAEIARAAAATKALEQVADEVVRAMDQLVKANLVVIRRTSTSLEVQIQTDFLFPSGSATLSDGATLVIDRLAAALRPVPNPIRVEGHTDSRPIKTLAFPSNWELSAARAASVVHVFANEGLDPGRLAVIGHAAYRPAQSNDTPEGRSANRRVVIVVLAPDGIPPIDPAGLVQSSEAVAAPAPAATPAQIATPAVTTPPAAPAATAAPSTASASASVRGTLPAP